MAAGDNKGPPAYLLDTTILVAYIRADALGKYVERRWRFRASPHKPLVCVVSVGEVLGLARYLKWGRARIGAMRGLLNQLVWVDISAPEILEAYAEIYHASRSMGRPMGQNDLWVAAAASATQAVLVTTDRDFDHLAAEYVKLQWINPRKGHS